MKLVLGLAVAAFVAAQIWPDKVPSALSFLVVTQTANPAAKPPQTGTAAPVSNPPAASVIGRLNIAGSAFGKSTRPPQNSVV